MPHDELAAESESVSPDDLLHQLQRDVLELIAFKNLVFRSFRAVQIIFKTFDRPIQMILKSLRSV